MSIGRLAQQITEPIFVRHGMGHGEIAHAWAEIVGPDLARFCQPERLTRPGAGGGATLIVRAQGHRTLEVHYAAQEIIEGVNALYGYQAIARVKVVQAPPGSPPAPPGRQQDRTRRAAPAPPTGYPGIGSGALGAALWRLERGLAARQSGTPRPGGAAAAPLKQR